MAASHGGWHAGERRRLLEPRFPGLCSACRQRLPHPPRDGTPPTRSTVTVRFSVIVPIAPGRQPTVLDSLERVDANGIEHEVVTQVGPNPSRNRNQSIARARGAILAFTDDDCQVASDWLVRAEAFFTAHPDFDVVGGPQLNAEAEGPTGRASGYALASWFGTYRQSRRYHAAPRRLNATQWDLSSANLLVTRRAFERWGPFDERLWPNEETMLLRRIEAEGGRIAYDPTVVVRHKRRTSLRGLARQCFGYGRGRARQSHIERARLPGIGQALPIAFLLYLVVLPLLAWRSLLALVPLAVYAAASVVISATTAIVRADPAAAAIMPPAFLAIHVGYTAGLCLETLRRLSIPGTREAAQPGLEEPMVTR